MTEREAGCIRAMLNFARNENVMTWAQLKEKMLKDGWSAEEAKRALVAIGPKLLEAEG